MSFELAAQEYAESLPIDSTDRIILEFLLEHSLGRENATPWAGIEVYLLSRGIVMRQQSFQQGLLKTSRSNNVFIGSNDHGDRGYFIIKDREDAELMRAWYLKRIKAEIDRVSHLEKLMKKEWP